MIGLLWTHLESALKYNWLRKCFLHMIFSHYSPHICCSSCLSALVLLSLRPPAAASDHWWISCVTSRAPCSRARGTTAQCWRPPQTDAHPKTCTPPSCRSKTTAVSDDYYIQVKQAMRPACLVPSGKGGNCRCSCFKYQQHTSYFRWNTFVVSELLPDVVSFKKAPWDYCLTSVISEGLLKWNNMDSDF